jgi:hypothetical protein
VQHFGDRWYAATLIFSSSIAGVESLRPLCEERIVLFSAANVSGATALAMKHGLSEEHSYRNRRNELVRWRFIGVERVEAVPFDGAGGGWEVASRYVRRSRKTIRMTKKSHGAGLG